MQYMLLIYNAPDAGPAPGSPEFQAQRGRWMEYTQQLQQSGAMVAGDALEGGDTATTVRQRNGDRVVSDGPFAETKELLGGYYLIDVPDLDTALDWAGKMPNIAYGSVEVRPIMDVSGG
ncbi:MAG: YciI family protein [Solirubrobacterales bacterium]|nr:YciI family protein [Solirubrobacterales bacterium]